MRARKRILIKGVAKDRRISVEDAQMRHGRKSRSVRVDGYKRHVLHDLDSGLIRAVGITSANAPEASVTPEISADLEQQGVKIKEFHIDRGYLSSHLVRERGEEMDIYCKAWPVLPQGSDSRKQAFTLNWDRQIIPLPGRTGNAFHAWRVAAFPKRDVLPMSTESAMHHQCERPQCEHPS